MVGFHERFSRALVALLFVLSPACGHDDRPLTDAGTTSDGGTAADAATDVDAGAAVDASPEVDAGPAADTWDGWAQGFFASYCTECHAGDPRDYRTIDDVVRDADTIRCGVSPTALDGCGSWPPPSQFPIGDGAKPTDAERERLVAWIDAGLP